MFIVLRCDQGGKTVVRKGDESNPAVAITSSKGVTVVKKASELHKLEEGEEISSKEKVETGNA
jgi:hypothetical protein